MDYFEDKELEQRYITDNAKFNIGDIVAYIEKATSKYIVGVIAAIKVDKQTYLRRTGNVQVPVIKYVITTPNKYVSKYQSEIFDVAEYLNRKKNG